MKKFMSLKNFVFSCIFIIVLSFVTMNLVRAG